MAATLIFDCDGVLSDTERFGHLPAFNQMFREFHLPVQWSPDDYAQRLRIAGGKERLASLLDDAFVAVAGLPRSREAQLAEVARWHQRKTAIYTAMVADGKLPPRPGIRRLIDEALSAGWTLAVASTSAPESVQAILAHAAGAANAARFAAVLAGDVVAKKKPAPDIYRLALQRLAAPADSVLVIEDSRNGLQAAHAAGLRCLITVNGYTRDEDFSEAQLVVSSLGDLGGEATQVLANRSRAKPGSCIGLGDLEACIASPHTSQPQRAASA